MTATRRTFLKRTAALGAVLALPAHETIALAADHPAQDGELISPVSPGGLPDTVRNMVVDATFGVSPAAPRWVTLVREMGDGTRPGVEVAGPGYERWPVEFLPAVNGATENATPALFIVSGKVAGFELWTEPEGGERVFWCGLT